MGHFHSKFPRVRLRKSPSKADGLSANLSVSSRGKSGGGGISKSVDSVHSSEAFTPVFTLPDFEEENMTISQAFDYVIRRPIVSPIMHRPKRILFISGHGMSTLPQLVRLYPEAKIVYYDIYPSTESPTPSAQCQPFSFNIITDDLPFSDNTFDLIVLRQANRALNEERWGSFMRECFRVCRPGGWLEALGQSTGIAKTGPCGKELLRCLNQVLELDNTSYAAIETLSGVFKTVGFPDPIHKRYQLPVGPWGGPVGEMVYQNGRNYFELLIQQLQSVGMHDLAAQFDASIDPWERELQNSETYMFIHATFAQKPSVKKNTVVGRVC